MSIGAIRLMGQLLRAVLWTAGLAVLAIVISFAATLDATFMLQFAIALVFVIPAFVMALRDSAALVPYTIGCWVFAPGLRRVVDWLQGGFHEFALIIVIPHLVTFAMLLALVQHAKGNAFLQKYRFLLLILIPFGYASLLGAALNKMSGLFDIAGYAAPLVLFFYLLARPLTEGEKLSFVRSAVAMAIVVSLYGWVQYLTLPPWDGFWIEHAGMTSVGQAAPMEFRMFSFMTSHGTAAVFLSTCLVLMIGNKAWRGPLGWAGMLLVATALSITLVRSAWVTLIVGLIAYIVYQNRANAKRTVALILLSGTVLYALIGLLPGAEHVTRRFQTFQNIQEDHSFQERMKLIVQVVPEIVRNPMGGGFGSIGRSTKLDDGESFAGLSSIDNGYLGAFSIFGIAGGLSFFAGLALLFRHIRKRADNGYRAIALSMILQLFAAFLFGGGLTGMIAVFFWLFAALAMRDDDGKASGAAAQT